MKINVLNFFYQKNSALARYTLAISIFLVALLLRFVLLPIKLGLGFITFYPTVIVVTYLCGARAGTIITILSSIAGYYFFMPPFFQFDHKEVGNIAVIIFLLSSYLMIFLIEKLQYYSGQLKISEARYLNILEEQTEFLCRFKIDGTILYTNQAFCHFFEKTREELVGSKWHPVVYQDDFAMINEKLSELSPENPIVTIENRIVKSDGIYWVQFVNSAFFDSQNELVELQSVGRNITKRKLLEQQLEISMKEKEDLYNYAPCGYHSVDKTGIIVQINETELQWLGYSREEVIGKMKAIDFFTDEGKDLFQKSFPTFLKQGYINNLDFELVHKNGSIRYATLAATSVKDDVGNVLFSRSVLHDISERKKLENDLIASELKLKQLFDKEQARRVEQSQFMAMLAHELKTPLAVIRIALGSMSETSIFHANKAITDIHSVIERCLQCEKIEDNQLMINTVDCHLLSLLNEICAAYQPNRFVINAEISPTLCADLQLLKTVLFNLADNAFKYSPAITNIDIRLASKNEGVLITFKNAVGTSGYPDEEKIFQKYYRAKTAHHQTGSGLGCYLVKTMANLMGGQVNYVRMEEEILFSLWLPLCPR